MTADYVELAPIMQFPGLTSFVPALGVVCVLARGQTLSERLKQLRKAGQIVVLFEEGKDLQPIPQTWDIYVLINFLAALTLRAHLLEGAGIGIDLEALQAKSNPFGYQPWLHELQGPAVAPPTR